MPYCLFLFHTRTEISFLKVKHVNLIGDTIFITGDIFKNGKDGVVTIPKTLKILLANHLQKATNEYYLFSDKNFLPGAEKLSPKKISGAKRLKF